MSGAVSRTGLPPFVRLEQGIDVSAIAHEAARIRSQFRLHRTSSDRPSEGWYSLALRAVGGDPFRTEAERHYGDADSHPYSNTKIAEQCPNAVIALRRIVDIHRCRRIRFMLLESGGLIPLHRDMNNGPAFTISFAITHPAGCRFLIQQGRSTKEDSELVEVPFRVGSAFLIDVSRHHMVTNRSEDPRLHIVVEGPPLKSLSELLSV